MNGETTRNIYCCGCRKDVPARLTDGTKIYPHLPELSSLPFWRCPDCKNYVGCHHKTSDPTRPLGVIPTSDIRRVRTLIHSKLDPLWKTGKIARPKAYAVLSKALGRQYHTADIRSIEEARIIYKAVKELETKLAPGKRES